MEGKILVVVYALVGIPLMLLLLAAIGDKLALAFKRIYKLNVCSTKPQVNRVLNMALIILLGLLLGFIAPATLFHYIEDWHFLEALYFCFTTLSTIGFGDYIIGIHEQRIRGGSLHETYEVVSYVWILFGLAYLSLVIKYISDLLIQKAQKVEQKTVRRLEGSRLFRRYSRVMRAAETTGVRSAGNLASRRGMEVDTPSSPHAQADIITQEQLEDTLPPSYLAEIGRINGDVKKKTSVVAHGQVSGDSVYTENGSPGVELLSINYI